MVKVIINGLPVEQPEGTTLLEAAQFLGFPIPTLCHEDGLAPYGGCRLCLVEIGNGPKTKLVTSCTYKVEPDLRVRTDSDKVIKARRLLLEMYVATCPDSKRIQDLCSEWGVKACRYEAKHEHCIQCGKCVRICEDQMMGDAIGFAGRGKDRHVSRPFNITADTCRQCGGCMYICPVCEQRCQGSTATTTLCNGCLNFAPVCTQAYDDAMCFLRPCHACELTGPLRPDVAVKLRATK